MQTAFSGPLDVEVLHQENSICEQISIPAHTSAKIFHFFNNSTEERFI